ncbi:MFS transporter [Dactylosporangium cerinum]|uniref:MFS transporter n=1 Tax=Dactylosporangium cerinum TaxID=1434730 RepID=A0ABV9WKV5_9ACTN
MHQQEHTQAVHAPAPARGLGVATFVISLARFIVVLDGTIMIVALPSIQSSLHIPLSDLNWVINSYSLMFGGLMLVAGRIGDKYGRKNVFRVGLVLFGAASLAGGLASDGTWLIALRAVQGIGAALATPGALSLLVSTFPEGKARARALGLYGAATGLAAVTGLLAGGVLTTYAGWEWVLFVNVPIVAAVLLGVGRLVEPAPKRISIDVPGALAGTLGIGALILGVNRVGEHGWSDSVVIACLAAATVLLSGFVLTQRISAAPMIPREVLSDRGRVGANVVTFIQSAGMFTTYFFLTLYMQEVLGYSALRTGLMYLPFAVGTGLAAGALGPQLLQRLSERAALSTGLLVAAAGTGWFCCITPESSIYAVLIPASVVTGAGIGIVATTGTSIGVRGIDSSEAGIGSAMLTAGGQVGGALGLAVLATVAASTTRHVAVDHSMKDALTSGYVAGFGIAAGLYLLCVAITLVTVKPLNPSTPG